MRTARDLYFVIAFLYTSLIAAYALLKPSFNSDMLYYVAAALSYRESDSNRFRLFAGKLYPLKGAHSVLDVDTSRATVRAASDL